MKRVEEKRENSFGAVRAKLLGMRQELIRESRQVIDQLVKEEGKYLGVSDDGDLADMAFREGMQAANLNRDRSRLRQIEEALRKIDEGTYGICEDCGDRIKIGRLQAMPFALRCVECQESYEMAVGDEGVGAYSGAATLVGAAD